MSIAVSAVPIRLRFPPGALAGLDLNGARAALRMQLRRSGLADEVIAAGMDLSFNEHADGVWPRHWQAHWYLAVLGDIDCNTVRNALTPYFKRDDVTPRPLTVRVLRDPFNSLSYLWKSTFFRRVSYTDRNGHSNTAYYDLKRPEERELLAFLHTRSATARLVLHNLRREGCRIAIRLRQDAVHRDIKSSASPNLSK
jgi:hypothetical protein